MKFRAGDCIAPGVGWFFQGRNGYPGVKVDEFGNSTRIWSLEGQMKSERHLSAAADFDATEFKQGDPASDRRLIRVDIPHAHAGITAALRRAFAQAAVEPCDRDFGELLRKLS